MVWKNLDQGESHNLASNALSYNIPHLKTLNVVGKVKSKVTGTIPKGVAACLIKNSQKIKVEET